MRCGAANGIEIQRRAAKEMLGRPSGMSCLEAILTARLRATPITLLPITHCHKASLRPGTVPLSSAGHDRARGWPIARIGPVRALAVEAIFGVVLML